MVEYYQRRSAKEPLEQVSKPYGSHELWVHVPDRRVDLPELAEQYGLDANILRDVYDIHERPRSEFKGGVNYIFIRLPSSTDAEATAPLLATIHQGQFFTVSPHVKFSPQDVGALLASRAARPSTLLVAVLARAVVDFEKRINSLEEKIMSARKRLRRHEVTNDDFVEFVTIDDRLNEYRRSLEGLVGVAKQLESNRHGLFATRDLESLEDISLHIQQLLVSITASAQTITSIQSAYSTIANNTLNQRMKVLTTITIFLAIPNVFYGMFGMNVDLPFQTEPWAYMAITGFTVLLILLVVAVARRSRLF